MISRELVLISALPLADLLSVFRLTVARIRQDLKRIKAERKVELEAGAD